MINETITQLVTEALAKLGLEATVTLEHPNDTIHGDFSCNVAMMLASKMTGSPAGGPKEVAEEIVVALPRHEYVERTEVAGPGFINFYLSEAFFAQQTKIVRDAAEKWGSNTSNVGKTILIEHSSPNLFKPFHIGHLVNNSYGEALVRIMRATGAKVVPLSFPSDVSPGIAKTVWAVLDKGWQDELTIDKIGEAYVYGVAQYEEGNKADIDAINASLYNKTEGTPEWEVYQKGLALSLDYFNTITARLGSSFEELIFESESEEVGKKIVREHTPGVFEESDGAIIFRGSEHGLFDNVFINSAGFGTYLAKDIGLVSLKFARYTFDTSVTVTDIEQKQHFELVKKAAGLVEKEWEEQSHYIQHGRLALTSGKISSRAGGVPLAEDIIEQVRARAATRMNESDREVNEETVEHIALAALKYAIVRVSMGKNITFDMETSLALEGDTGPYLQYTYARARSILRKADGVEVSNERTALPVTDIERLLYRFEAVVARAANEREPHYIAHYLAELASTYNSWYATEQVLDGGDAQGYKLALTQAVATTLKNGLWMLGIEAPEEM